MFSKLLVEGTHPRIFNVYKNIGMVVNGKVPDGVHVMSHGRS
jgi:20S proteasome alpha/beta subunit